MAKKRRVKKIIQLKRPSKTEFESSLEQKVQVIIDEQRKQVQLMLDTHRKDVNEQCDKILTLFRDDVVKQTNGVIEKLNETVQKLALQSAIQAGTVKAQVEAMAESVELLDNNILATSAILKEVFGQLQQCDEFFKLLDPNTDGKPLGDRVDPTSVRDGALAWYKDVVQDAFQKVFADKKAAAEARQKAREEEAKKKAAEEEAKAVATAAEIQLEADRAEAARAQEALNKAEEPSLTPSAPGPGSDVPEGAEVFGG